MVNKIDKYLANIPNFSTRFGNITVRLFNICNKCIFVHYDQDGEIILINFHGEIFSKSELLSYLKLKAFV